MYKAVIFDFFGVFCPDMSLEWFKENVPSHRAKLAEFQAIATRSDLGRLDKAGFFEEVGALAGVPAEKVRTGIESKAAIDTALVDYVAGLKKRGLTVACLSNGSDEWTRQMINDHGLGDLFDLIVLSADAGIVKPDPKIFKVTLERLKTTASQAILVDDRQTNTKAAEALGIRSLLFTDTPSFIKDFERIAATGL